MVTVLQWVVAALGLYSIYLAGKHAIFFIRSRKRVGRSMVFMLLEQVVSATCTLAFSLNSLLQTIQGLDPEDWNAIDNHVAILLRCCMFCAMIHSTTHLSTTIRKVIEREEAEETETQP